MVRERQQPVRSFNLDSPRGERRAKAFMGRFTTEPGDPQPQPYVCGNAACLCEGDCLDFIEHSGKKCSRFECAGPAPVVCFCEF